MEKELESASLKYNVRLSFKEELGNVITHGVMAFFFMSAMPMVAIHAYLKGGMSLAIGTSIFMISMFLMFLSSTLYHAMDFDSKHKYIFRILDHAFIYVAIAGSYTPIALYVLGGTTGYIVVAIQWICAVAGIVYKSISRTSRKGVSLAIYLVMGWSAIFFAPELISKTSPMFIGLILAGGIAYSIGAWFYAQKERPYFHMIWHLFINIAAICHFVAIVFFI